MSRMGRIGVYGKKTRRMQKRLTRETFGLTFKEAKVWLFRGSRYDNEENDIFNLGNPVFQEFPDRKYELDPKCIPIGMEPMQEMKMDFSRFGVIDPMGNEIPFRIFQDDMNCLERPLIVGDVLEVPFFETEDRKALWEITDVDYKVAYEKFIVIVYAEPADDSRKTRELPISNPTGVIIDEFDMQREMSAEENIPNTGYAPDGEVPQGDVDYRHDREKSFLDDPNKKF